ncbi:MAG: NRDE family protein [Acidobacteriota bacterium]
MCTASWIHEDGGFQLLFNRDEKRTRLRAEAPRIQTRGGVLTIAPVDGDHGGSWISVNEHGVALCLLNGTYGAGGLRSRGLLLLDLADARSAEGALDRLHAADPFPYAPFTIGVFEPGRKASIVEWNGALLNITSEDEAPAPLASSSFDAPGARMKRREEFARIMGAGPANAARLLQFHKSHGAGPDAYSPCMHRADAETVSFSHVQVSPREVSFFYTPAAPCQRLPGETIVIPRTS